MFNGRVNMHIFTLNLKGSQCQQLPVILAVAKLFKFIIVIINAL